MIDFCILYSWQFLINGWLTISQYLNFVIRIIFHFVSLWWRFFCGKINEKHTNIDASCNLNFYIHFPNAFFINFSPYFNIFPKKLFFCNFFHVLTFFYWVLCLKKKIYLVFCKKQNTYIFIINACVLYFSAIAINMRVF